MKPEHIKQIIEASEQVLVWMTTVTGAIIGVHLIIKEISIGKGALSKVKEENASLKREIEELKGELNDLTDQIQQIQRNYEAFMQKMLNNFPFK